MFIHVCNCVWYAYIFYVVGLVFKSSGFFHTGLFWLYDCVSYAWVSWRGRVRIYILVEFTCGCVYITSRYTRSRHVCG